ncbi:GTPase [Natroniella sp. ANB-PHB2]|uniref:GTPase n=1 Tax=Natroniella sp. ANB-PHB2 TaxID=3384444 RepID=UPI0038D3902A
MAESKARKFEEELEKEYERVEASIKKPNVLLVGATGVGKSSLVNLIFGEELAEVGVGEPVTEAINIYRKPDVSIVLYDTAGYEIGSKKQEKFSKEVVEFVIDNQRSVDRQMHLAWYCIDAAGHRITDLDLKTIKKIYCSNIPVGVLFTKCDLVSLEEIESLETELYNELPNISSFRLTTLNDPSLDYLDLNKLTSWSIKRLPQGLKLGFIKAQKRNLDEKKAEAKKAIKQHVSGATLIGGSPIPFSDAPLLITNQTGMFARILNIYDMEYMIKDARMILSSIGIKKIISGSGIWLAAQITKFIPVKGTVIGGLISAGVAAAITTAIGLAVSEMCYRISKAAIEGKEEELKDIVNNFKPMLGELFREYYEEKNEIS